MAKDIKYSKNRTAITVSVLSNNKKDFDKTVMALSEFLELKLGFNKKTINEIKEEEILNNSSEIFNFEDGAEFYLK